MNIYTPMTETQRQEWEKQMQPFYVNYESRAIAVDPNDSVSSGIKESLRRLDEAYGKIEFIDDLNEARPAYGKGILTRYGKKIVEEGAKYYRSVTLKNGQITVMPYQPSPPPTPNEVSLIEEEDQ